MHYIYDRALVLTYSFHPDYIVSKFLLIQTQDKKNIEAIFVKFIEKEN